MFRKILAPLDGSPEAERALNPAVRLAQAAKGEVLLLRSMKVVHMMMPSLAVEYEWMWPEYSREESRQEIRSYLDGVAEQVARPDVTLRTLAVEGDSASVIVDTAVDEDIDLIVMSAQGWSTPRVRELGSVSERVLHRAPCPVLMVRKEPIHRIAVTLDGSSLAERALAPGVALADALQAELVLLRVNEPEFFRGLLPAAEKLAVEQDRELARAYLQDQARRLGTDVETFAVAGTAVEGILQFVEDHHVDLLVMCTHGRTGLRRWLYGSVTARVLRASQTSMLIIRPPDYALSG
ncbi:MAG: universal stress protein [Ardenticatenaceae bacterium]|nr:universal stress protein [Anaerolineales bacterium]MCB8983819.1 universal stress protein [Ardenticatenaceae bacterium]